MYAVKGKKKKKKALKGLKNGLKLIIPNLIKENAALHFAFEKADVFSSL